MSYDLNDFVTESLEPGDIVIDLAGENGNMRTTQIGTILLTNPNGSPIDIAKSFYVPDYTSNFSISIGQFDDLGFQITFRRNMFMVKRNGKLFTCTTRLQNSRLYLISFPRGVSSRPSANLAASYVGDSSFDEIVNGRFTHRHHSMIRRIYPDYVKSADHLCRDCIVSKIHQCAFIRTYLRFEMRAKSPLQTWKALSSLPLMELVIFNP